MKLNLFLIILLLILLLYLSCNNKVSNKEFFATEFGSPPEATIDDNSNIKSLLEIGSQADENSRFDVVSTKYLGDLSGPKPKPQPPPPPDPVCFTGKYYGKKRNSNTLDDIMFNDCCN